MAWADVVLAAARFRGSIGRERLADVRRAKARHCNGPFQCLGAELFGKAEYHASDEVIGDRHVTHLEAALAQEKIIDVPRKQRTQSENWNNSACCRRVAMTKPTTLR